MRCAGSGNETTIHFFLHCANFNTQRQTLFNKISTIDANILTENEAAADITFQRGQSKIWKNLF